MNVFTFMFCYIPFFASFLFCIKLKYKRIFHLNLDSKTKDHLTEIEILKNKTADKDDKITVAPHDTQKRVSNSVTFIVTGILCGIMGLITLSLLIVYLRRKMTRKKSNNYKETEKPRYVNCQIIFGMNFCNVVKTLNNFSIKTTHLFM